MTRTLCCLLLGAGLCFSAGSSNGADRAITKAPLKRILEGMAARHGFEIGGLSSIGTEIGVRGTGEAISQIERLLADYNYVLLRKPDGGVERLIVTGRKRAAPPPVPKGIVATRRSGRHHIVDAVLRGPDGSNVNTSLMLDTGASMVVLPSSMIPRLGFAPDQLRKTRMRTANRAVWGYVGVLPSVEVGGLSSRGVGVAFVEDDRLQGARLLGMSFLRRFRVTIDDENSRITLIQNE